MDNSLTFENFCQSTPIQLTHGVRGTELTNGLADYIAQEEMDRYE